MTDHTYNVIIARAIQAAQANGLAVVDATFGKIAQREILRERLVALGIQPRFVEIDASDDTIRERLRRREQSQTEVSDARVQDFEMLSAAYEQPDAGEDRARVIVKSGPSVEATAIETLKALARLNLHKCPSLGITE